VDRGERHAQLVGEIALEEAVSADHTDSDLATGWREGEARAGCVGQTARRGLRQETENRSKTQAQVAGKRLGRGRCAAQFRGVDILQGIFNECPVPSLTGNAPPRDQPSAWQPRHDNQRDRRQKDGSDP
jgi:hypothetical protein